MKRIPPIKLEPIPLTEEARSVMGFEWADPIIGTRHRLGGMPERDLSQEYWPRCKDCREAMTFYGQLDSIGDDVCVADVGLIYVFICLDCNEVFSMIDTP